MTKVLDWESVGDGSGKGKKGKSNFMKLVAGTYQVRPIGAPVEFSKFMVQGSDGKWRSAVCVDADDNPVSLKHNIKPTPRYAVVAIDRADGEIKILEAGVSVFKEFRAYFKYTGKNPGGKQGADFRIVVEGSGRTKRYTTSLVRATPITDEESASLKEMFPNGLDGYLEKVYEATPDEQLEEKLFGEAVVSGKTGNKSPVVTTRPVVDEDDAPNSDVSPEEEVKGDEIPF